MFAKQQISDLAERRDLLVREVDLHRSLLRLERENLRARLAGLRAARERVYAHSLWLVAGGAAAGLLTVRHWPKFKRWVPAALMVLRWVRHWQGG